MVIGRVGDIDPDTLDPTRLSSGLLATQIDLFWEMYADKDFWGPRLRELYTQLECIDAKLAAWSVFVDFQDGATSANIRQSQKIATLTTMRTNVQARITQLEALYAKTFRAMGSVKLLTRTAPVMPPVIPLPGPVDQNDPRFAGDAYIRSPDPV